MIKIGYDYNEIYEMTIIEMENTLNYRRQGIAYTMWRTGYMQAIAISSCFDKKSKFPRTPEGAFPELFPAKPVLSIKSLPSNIIEKYTKRGGKKHER